MKHRKLHPAPNGANGTDCDSDLCDPSFDPYSFYYSQPPPPPLPLPSPLAIPDDQAHGVSVSPSIIVLITLLASFSLLTGYYVVVSKSCFGLCRRRNNQNYSQSGGEDEDDDDDDDDELDHQNNRAVDHPIWFITTVGLQQAIINSITVVKYKRNEGLIEGTECSVCLNEFREDETLRLLPKCSHAFHIPCIDTWLRSHTNCPLCRANIVNDINTNRRSTNIVGSNSGNQSGGDDTDQETPMGNSEIGTTGQRVDQDLNNSDGNCVLERRNEDDNCEEMVRNKVRLVRSVSMDSSSSSLGILNYKICEMENHNVFGRSNGREFGQSKQCLRIRPVAMKRSLSCRGRFLSSRQNQRLNSILLPL